MTVRKGMFRGSRRIATLLVAVFVCAATAVAVARSTSATVTTHQGKLGTMLAGRNGHTLYLFMHDTGSKSSCYGGCATAWPPDITHGRPLAAAGSGVNAKLLGTTRRKNGSLQVTYNGHPLYFYGGDKQPGSMHGENAYAFKGRWYAVNIKGAAIKPKKPAVGGVWNPGSY
jgi:predicted lipoprotein with Yx(FWY)xxD motif